MRCLVYRSTINKFIHRYKVTSAVHILYIQSRLFIPHKVQRANVIVLFLLPPHSRQSVSNCN